LQVAGAAADTRLEERSPVLTAYHEAEHHLLAVARVKAAQTAELEATNRAHQRLLAALQDTADDSRKGLAPTKIAKTDLDNIRSQLDSIANRITELEKLVLVHDDLLKKLAPRGGAGK
jgi:hypothetical protein